MFGVAKVPQGEFYLACMIGLKKLSIFNGSFPADPQKFKCASAR
jgi:hypothetical protein